MANNGQVYDDKLAKFRDKYGKVAKIVVGDTDVYLRSITFNNWIKLVRETKFIIDANGNVDQQISERAINEIILPCVIDPQPLPDEIIRKPIYVNLIVTSVLNITDFDKPDVLLEKYKKAHARQQLLAMDMKRRLIATYGIGVLDRLDNASVDEVIELIAMGEWINQNIGDFAESLGVSNLIPRNQKGQVNIKKATEMLQSWLYESTPNDKPSVTVDVFKNNAPPKTQPTDVPKPPKQESVKTIGDIIGDLNESNVKQSKQSDSKTITISDIETKQDIDNKKDDLIKTAAMKLKEPKFYDLNSSDIHPMVLERSRREFGGNLINLWNENMAALYNKIKDDLEHPKKIKTFEEIQREDEKSHVILDTEPDSELK